MIGARRVAQEALFYCFSFGAACPTITRFARSTVLLIPTETLTQSPMIG
jgi:hypothetical protein